MYSSHYKSQSIESIHPSIQSVLSQWLHQPALSLQRLLLALALAQVINVAAMLEMDQTDSDTGSVPEHENIPVISPEERANLPEGTHVIEKPAQKVPFKEQVIGVAQKARGTVTSNVCPALFATNSDPYSRFTQPELKQHGTDILEGTAPAVKPQ